MYGCEGCGLNNKNIREVIIQHDTNLLNCPFLDPFIIKRKERRDKVVQNNHNHEKTSDFYKDHDTKTLYPPKATIPHHQNTNKNYILLPYLT